MSINAFLMALRARGLIILWTLLIAGISAYLVAGVLPESYQASAKVQVSALRKNPLTGTVEPAQRVNEFLGQQAAVISSRTVALKVVDTLLQEGALPWQDLQSEWREQTGGEMLPGNDLKTWIADELMDSLQIQSSISESTLTVNYKAETSARAARYANAFADAYMITVLEQRKRRAERNAASFSEETKTFEKKVEKAREELAEFQQHSGMVTIGPQQLESAEVELASLTNRLSEARADSAEAQALWDQATRTRRDELITIPLPTHDVAGRAAQGRLATINTQMERLAARYGINHPDYIELVSEREAKLDIVFNSIRERFAYTKRRADELAAEVARQKQIVVGLYDIKQKFDILENTLNTNSQTYDLVAARQLQESLQSRLDMIDVFMLSRAVPAGKPVISRKLIITVIGLFLGFGLGTATALLIELLEGKLRTREHIQFLTRCAVLAEVGRSPDKKAGAAP